MATTKRARKIGTQTVVQHAAIEADSAYLIAGDFVEKLIVRLNGITIPREDAKTLARFMELHLSGDTHEFAAT